MSKFKKEGKKGAPAVNTSSLPDIVFMLLFFFMVATTSKDADPSVIVEQPEGVRATDLTPYKQRSEIDFMYLGTPRNPARRSHFEDGYALFLDNVQENADKESLYQTTAIQKWKLDKYNEKQSKSSFNADIIDVITCVKADENAPAGRIFEIRNELEKVDGLTIAYAVKDNGNM